MNFLERTKKDTEDKINSGEIPEKGRVIFHPINKKDYFLADTKNVYFKRANNKWIQTLNQDTINDVLYISKYGKNSFIDSKKTEDELREAEKRKTELKEKQEELENSYKMLHTAPTKGYGVRGDDLIEAYGEDIYSKQAIRYYGDGDNLTKDSTSIFIMQNIKNNPDMLISIYRAIPCHIESDINSGDWISINKEYAIQHGESYFENGYKILSKEVRVCEIYTDGNSIHEWGYSPEEEYINKNDLKRLISIDEFEARLSTKRSKKEILSMYNQFLENSIKHNQNLNKELSNYNIKEELNKSL